MILYAYEDPAFFIKGHAACKAFEPEIPVGFPILLINFEPVLPCNKDSVPRPAGDCMNFFKGRLDRQLFNIPVAGAVSFSELPHFIIIGICLVGFPGREEVGKHDRNYPCKHYKPCNNKYFLFHVFTV